MALLGRAHAQPIGSAQRQASATRIAASLTRCTIVGIARSTSFYRSDFLLDLHFLRRCRFNFEFASASSGTRDSLTRFRKTISRRPGAVPGHGGKCLQLRGQLAGEWRCGWKYNGWVDRFDRALHRTVCASEPAHCSGHGRAAIGPHKIGVRKRYDSIAQRVHWAARDIAGSIERHNFAVAAIANPDAGHQQ